MVAKSFPRNQVWTRNFHQKVFGRKFLWLQNHFLEIRLETKIFIKIFFRKFFIIAKSFPRKQVWTRNFHQNFLVETFLWLQNHFLEIRFEPKFFINNFFRQFFMVAKSFPRKPVWTRNFHQNFSVETFLWMQNHFLGNRF